MKVDIDGLNDEVKPQLEKAIKKLDEAKNKLTGIDIPDDFYFYSKLSNMPQDISDINENIKNFEKWLDGKISGLGNAESSNKGLIDSILAALFGGDIGNGTSYASGKNVADLEGKELLDTFWYTMFEGEQSDVDVLTMAYYSCYEEVIYNKNPEAEKFVKKLIEVKRDKPDFKFTQSYWSFGGWTTDELKMYKEWFDQDESYKIPKGTFFHEMGHILFGYDSKSQLPPDFDEVMEKARIHSTKNGAALNDFAFNARNNLNNDYSQAEAKLIEEIKSKGYNSVEEWKADYAKQIEERIEKYGWEETVKWLEFSDYESGTWDQGMHVGIDENWSKMLLDENTSPTEIANEMYNYKYYEYGQNNFNENHHIEGAISDIIDAAYLGDIKDSDGNSIVLSGGHGKGFYDYRREYGGEEEAKRAAFDEMMANFTQVKMSGSEKDLETIKVILGDECYNMMEETYNSFLK